MGPKNERRRFLIVSGIFVAALMVMFLSVGCQKQGSGEAQIAAPKEKTNMAQTSTQIQEKAVIPPIDASAPARVETATFALG